MRVNDNALLTGSYHSQELTEKAEEVCLVGAVCDLRCKFFPFLKFSSTP
jgi:hypothetical protein